MNIDKKKLLFSVAFLDSFIDYLVQVSEEGEKLEFIEGFEGALEILVEVLENLPNTDRSSMS